MNAAATGLNWRLQLPLALALAAAVHLASIWAYPRVVMRAVLHGVAAQGPAGQVVLPPATDHTQRRIVMPSPDLLYALCAYDLTAGPLTVTADPQLPVYWSIALYAANTDNFHVLHDRQAGGQPVRFVVAAPGGPMPEPSVQGARVLVAPSTRGLLLMRLLDDAAMPAERLDAARRTLRCDQGLSGR